MDIHGMDIREDWYRDGFNALYPVVYGHRTVEAARPEAAFAADRLKLKNDHRVLDLGCGTGRHMVHLTPLTGSVVGLDYSPYLLSMAHESVGQAAQLVRGDMRSLPFFPCFDAVVNFFTSFGYFPSADENRQVVREVARVLKRGGRFLIDYLNTPFVEKTLVSESVRQSNGYTICENRWIDHRAHRVNKITKVYEGDSLVGRWGESVRLYDERQFRALLAAGGLTVEQIFGDYTGAPLSDIQPRMIVVGRKG